MSSALPIDRSTCSRTTSLPIVSRCIAAVLLLDAEGSCHPPCPCQCERRNPSPPVGCTANDRTTVSKRSAYFGNPNSSFVLRARRGTGCISYQGAGATSVRDRDWTPLRQKLHEFLLWVTKNSESSTWRLTKCHSRKKVLHFADPRVPGCRSVCPRRRLRAPKTRRSTRRVCGTSFHCEQRARNSMVR